MQFWKQWKTQISFPLYLKCASVLLLFALCVLIVACGSTTTTKHLSNTTAVPTIDPNGSSGMATPPLPQYLCGAWVTDTSPPLKQNSVINVFAKFVQNGADGNPVGVDAADGTATVNWPDGTTDTTTAKTTADGLAVFSIILKPVSLNKVVIVAVAFAKVGGPSCTVPQSAYFTPTTCNGGKHCHNKGGGGGGGFTPLG